MGRPRSERRLIIDEYIKQFPEARDYTLSRKVYEENKKVFSSIEDVRTMLRFAVGHRGNKDRQYTTMTKPLTYDTNNSKPENINTSARILVMDIETAPLRAYVWGIWNQNVSIGQIESDWFCLTWAAKWLFEDKVYSGKVTPSEARKQDDRRILKGIWQLLNEADIVIAHNGDKFDIPRLNSRFVIHGWNPPLPYQSIDTLRHIRKQFGFSSNKLDYVNKLLSLERKSETGGFELWEKCYQGDKESIDKMEEYNINDVRILEDTYLRIRSWIKPHPNIALHILDETQSRCPNCGSDKLLSEGKKYHTTANVYEVLRCENCGSTARKRLSDITIKQRRHLVLSVPK